MRTSVLLIFSTYEDICTLMEDEIDSGICSKLEALGLPCACPMDPKKYDMSVDVPPIDLGAIGIAVGVRIKSLRDLFQIPYK